MTKDNTIAEKTNIKNPVRILDALFLFLLSAYPFLHVNTGLSVSDTGYNLLNSFAFPNINRTWAVSTVFANVTGHVLSKLPFGSTVLGMNIYSLLLSAIFVAVFYLFMRKFYDPVSVFAGMLIALGFCWCPRVILYHYLSYFLFDLGAVLLLLAIFKEKKILYPIAGGVLALNIFVRFPNVVECVLILVLFFAGILKKKNILREFLLCVLGYAVVFLIGLLLVSVVWGRDAFPSMIQSLFGMTKEATSYTPKSMLAKIFGDYLMYLKFFLPYLFFAVLAGILFCFIKKKAVRIVILAGLVLSFAFIAAVEYRRYGAFNFTYYDYRSIFMFGTFLLMIAIFLAVYGLFRKDLSAERKVLGFAVVLIIFVTPIGSNNGLYTAFNNMFLAAPYVIGELIGVFREKQTGEQNGTEKRIAFRKGIYLAALIMCVFVLCQSVLFCITFVFQDAPFTTGRFDTVRNNPVVSGIRTEEESAACLQELNDYLIQNDLKHKSAICYNNTPGLFFYLEEECALSHAWPDLDSFPVDELKADLERLEKEEKYPLFFDKAREEDLLSVSADDLEKEKDRLFAKFLSENGYRISFQNSLYVLYEKAD